VPATTLPHEREQQSAALWQGARCDRHAGVHEPLLQLSHPHIVPQAPQFEGSQESSTHSEPLSRLQTTSAAGHGPGVAAGFALQAATSNAAQFMGQLDSRGTIEVGKIADLVLLDKNPLADIHNTRSIRAIVLNGRIMPRATLDAMLAEAEALANK